MSSFLISFLCPSLICLACPDPGWEPFCLHAEKWQMQESPAGFKGNTGKQVKQSQAAGSVSPNCNQSGVYIRVFSTGKLRSDASGLFLKEGKILVFSGDKGLALSDPFLRLNMQAGTIALFERHGTNLKAVDIAESKNASIQFFCEGKQGKLAQGQELKVYEGRQMHAKIKEAAACSYDDLLALWPRWLKSYAKARINNQVLAGKNKTSM